MVEHELRKATPTLARMTITLERQSWAMIFFIREYFSNESFITRIFLDLWHVLIILTTLACLLLSTAIPTLTFYQFFLIFIISVGYEMSDCGSLHDQVGLCSSYAAKTRL